MAEKYVTMVDAGYVFAEGSKLVFDEMTNIRIDGRKFIDVVENLITKYVTENEEGMFRNLRTYWYDAKDRSSWIAPLPGITLRLGRVNQKGIQKGVDGAIIKDMLTLSKNNAISDIFIISGDEDLIEGVSEVKYLGIKVHFIRFDTKQNNMSFNLLNQADGLINVNKEDMLEVFSKNEYVERHTEVDEELEKAFQFLLPTIEDTISIEELTKVKPKIPQVVDKLIFKDILGVEPAEAPNADKVRIRKAFWSFISRV